VDNLGEYHALEIEITLMIGCETEQSTSGGLIVGTVVTEASLH
jgi:hypothetical protein